jgi:hypothetical protein
VFPARYELHLYILFIRNSVSLSGVLKAPRAFKTLKYDHESRGTHCTGEALQQFSISQDSQSLSVFKGLNGCQVTKRRSIRARDTRFAPYSLENMTTVTTKQPD